MKIQQRTVQNLTQTYRNMRLAAEAVDQLPKDTDRRDGYVTVEQNYASNDADKWSLDGATTLNSFPKTSSKEVSPDPLISRKTEIKALGIEQREYSEDPELGKIRRDIEFIDDGQTLRATESIISYNDDNFLASSEQSYIIYKKSGKMRTLKPRHNDSPLG